MNELVIGKAVTLSQTGASNSKIPNKLVIGNKQLSNNQKDKDEKIIKIILQSLSHPQIRREILQIVKESLKDSDQFTHFEK